MPNLQKKKSKLGDIKISFRQVLGTPEDARRVFQSINSDTKRLDKYEEYHLRSRGSDAYYAIYACCYINDNKSNLEELQYTRLNELIELGERIHQLLLSGSQTQLPTSNPLRTVHASFPAHGSSLC